MKKSVYFLFFIILINFNVIKASEKISLISLNDIKIIFSTDSKTWNQNLVFLDKKLSMKKLQLENNSNYSLKTTFSNGYLVITPYFKPVSYTHLRAHETREDRGLRGGL